MRVRIKSEINVEADTFDEALAEVRKQLKRQYESSLNDSLIDEYHHWDVENDGDVDWIPISNVAAKSRSVFHVKNTNEWSTW